MSPEPPGDPGPRQASLADRAVFTAQFLRAPVATASVWPSTTTLARTVADAALRAAPPHPVVVELGAGSGAFTSPLTHRLAGRGRQLAVEINPMLAHRLAERFPAVEVVPADAAELPALLALRGIRRAHAVISGLGWSATRPGRDDCLLPVMAHALADDGVLVQLAYLWTSWAPPARALRNELAARFTHLQTSRVVWRNLPPAIVYRASRPRR